MLLYFYFNLNNKNYFTSLYFTLTLNYLNEILTETFIAINSVAKYLSTNGTATTFNPSLLLQPMQLIVDDAVEMLD